jgi:hypothetical protein
MVRCVPISLRTWRWLQLLSIVRISIVKNVACRTNTVTTKNTRWKKSYHNIQLLQPSLRIFTEGQLSFYDLRTVSGKRLQANRWPELCPSNSRDNYQTANWQGLIRPSNKYCNVSSFLGFLSDLGSEPKRYVLGCLTHRTRFRPRLGPLGP